MSRDSGQIHTIEGIVAALILLVILLFVTQSITFVNPQTEKSVDMNLSVMASDILTNLNTGNEYHVSELKKAIEVWNGIPIASGGGAASGMAGLDKAIKGELPLGNLPENMGYSVSLHYDEAGDGTGWTDKLVISHGQPNDNAITSSKLVTINVYDDQFITTRSAYWYDNNRLNSMPIVVAVRLSLWYL